MRQKHKAITASDKTDFKSKTLTRNKGGHYTVIKGSVHQDDIKIVNVYTQHYKA